MSFLVNKGFSVLSETTSFFRTYFVDLYLIRTYKRPNDKRKAPKSFTLSKSKKAFATGRFERQSANLVFLLETQILSLADFKNQLKKLTSRKPNNP